jgi:putative MATE family efflux protein
MIVNLFGMVLVFPLNSYFIHTLGLGFYGPAYVWVIVNWIMVFAQFAYFYGSGLNKICMPHKILSWSLFKGWIQYLRVALPAVGAVAAEWLAFEMQTIVASRLGSRALASQALVTSINALIFNVPLSNAVAVSCRLGAFLGARKPSAGLLAYKTALKIAWITQLITAGVLWIFAYEIVSLFTDVEAIKEMTVDVLPLLSLFCLVDGFQGMIQGVLRGFAAQSYAFVMNLFWFWIISLPLSIYLSLYVGTHQYGSTDQNGPVQGMGLVGIWISLLIGSSGILVSYLVYLGKTSWTQRTNFIYASLLEEEREQMLLASQKSELSDEEDGDGDSNTGDGDDYDGDSLTQNINSINNNSFGSMNNSNNPDRNNQCHETPLLDISNPLSGRSYGGLE